MPEVSIVIPSVGRPYLPAVISSIAGQAASLDWTPQVVVSFDAPVWACLKETVTEVAGTLPVEIVRTATRTGVSGARNRGAAAADGEILLFLDEDVIPLDGWLEAITHPSLWCGGLVLGRLRSRWSNRAPDQLRSLCYESRHRVNSCSRHHESCIWGPTLGYLSGGNCGIRRDIFEALSGFDPRIPVGQDRDLAVRAIRDGRHIHYAAEASAQHVNDGSWTGLLRGRFRSGQTEGRNGALHASPEDTLLPYGLFRHPRASVAGLCGNVAYTCGKVLFRCETQVVRFMWKGAK